MDALAEIATKLYAQQPLATVALGILLTALFGMMLHALIGHLRAMFQKATPPETRPTAAAGVSTSALAYAAALGRVAGFFLPLPAQRPVEWAVGPAGAGSLRRGWVFDALRLEAAQAMLLERDGVPMGRLLAWFSDDDRQQPRAEWTEQAKDWLPRIAAALASTYASIEGPDYRARHLDSPPADFTPDFVLSTAIAGAELTPPSAADGVFHVALDATLLSTLTQAEAAHTHERGEFATYLEHEVVTAFQAWRQS